ncbi:MAG: diacylglycerol kinase family protein [Vampirovibrio sp.]|nr:diacylglycerol kinase family protein [Vampirovibrio sp.]
MSYLKTPPNEQSRQAVSVSAGKQARKTQRRVEALLDHGFRAKSFWHSLGFALEGWWYLLKAQRNFLIDLVVAAVVLGMSAFFSISTLEWVVVILLIGGVLATEAMNTALESLVDLYTEGAYHPKAKIIKDVSAGACLILAVTSVTVGGVIFVPRILAALGA